MRLLIVSNLFPPDVIGGYELLCADVAERLRRRGHEVEVLTTGAERPRETRVHRRLVLNRPFSAAPRGRDRVRQWWATMINGARTRAFLAARPDFDAVLAMSQRRLGLAPLYAAQGAGLPIVATVNDDWPVAYAARGRGPHLRPTDRGLVVDPIYVSAAIRDEVRGHTPSWPPGQVAFQGVDLDRFRPRPPRPLPAAPRLLFLGRLHPSKGPDRALDALAALRQRGCDATLTLAGPAFPTELAALTGQAQRLGVTPHVTFLGACPRQGVPDLLHRHDAMLLPTRWEEPLGLTQLEAMACAVPVIGTPTGGARELDDRLRAILRPAGPTGADIAAEVEAAIDAPERVAAHVRRGLEASRLASLEGYVATLEGALLQAAQRARPASGAPRSARPSP